MRQIGLIARREIVENLRTKGFWLTALSPPLIMLLVTGLVFVTQVSETQLSFAVIDHSQWLAGAVRDRTSTEDLDDLLDGLAMGKQIDLPPRLANLEKLSKSLTKAQRRAMVRTTHASVAPTPWPASTPWLLRRWWSKVSADDLPDWLASTSRARFYWLDNTAMDEASLRDAVSNDRIFGYFVLPADPINGGEPLRFVSRNLTNPDLLNWFRATVTATVRERRLFNQNVSASMLEWVNQPLEVQTIALTHGHANEVTRQDLIGQWAPALLAYILWVSVFAMSQMLLTTTVEEKSSRLADVLLAAVTADDLLAGKVLGVAMTGFAVLGVWFAMGGAAIAFLPSASGGAAIHLSDLAVLSHPIYWLSFIVYFLLGYLLLASAIAGLGALTSSLRDAQNLMFPVQMLLMVPLASIVPVSRAPDGALATALTWIPPFTPFVMMNRAAQPPSIWVYAATTMLLCVSIWATWRLASRLFSAGMLMSGGAPRFRELPALLRKR